jgi:hypothetical protein
MAIVNIDFFNYFSIDCFLTECVAELLQSQNTLDTNLSNFG